MPKISNQDIYNQDDTLSMNDYTIGSNSNTGNKKTQTYTFASIFSLFYNFLGYNAFLNTTDTTTYPIGTPGCFYVFDENDVLTTDFSEARKITFSSYDTYNFDTANYFNIIVSSGKFLFKLINLEDKNNFVFLKPSNFVLGGTGTTFNVDVLAESGLSNGSFVNYKRYLLVLEFAAGTFPPSSIISKFIFNEIPSGIIDGINSIFNTNFLLVPDTEVVFINGQKQKKPDDYNISGQTITFTFSPGVSESIVINYIKQ